MEQSFVLPIMTLMHPVSSYRFSINRGDVQMCLIDKAFYSELWWRNGIMLIENYCELPVVLPDKLQIDCWTAKKHEVTHERGLHLSFLLLCRLLI